MRREEIGRHITAMRPRIAHLHGVWDPIVRRASAECARLGTSWVLSSHGMLHPFTLRQGGLKKLVYLTLFPSLVGGARTVLTLNQEEAEAVVARFGVCADVVPSGIHPEAYELAVDGSFSRSIPGLGGRSFVLFLGRLDPIKGIDRLLDAYGVAVSGGMDADLVIAGPDFGAERGLRGQVARLGLGDRVHFCGSLSGNLKLQAIAECAFFAHRPRYEGFGIAVVEAMAAGRAVVTTAACRLDGAAAAGALLQVDDTTSSFAMALARLADDPREAHLLGARARAWVGSELSWTTVLERVERCYRT
jgi:glycosyltransferase involved in cell wall biosynthesis